ncbi:MAG: hypothetical protein H0U03_08020 [Actinobacteria bacterium]|nr:hypothetical protein [Actinomycetota bacterium]
MKRSFLIAGLFAALIVLALGGWAVQGARRAATASGIRRRARGAAPLRYARA